jgi:hypothetical protein
MRHHNHKRRLCTVIGLAGVLIGASAPLAQAQYMSVSHYADQYADQDNIVQAYLSAEDNSTGCDHTSYEMDISGGGPSSSWGNTVYGLSGGGGTALAEEGEYWAESHLIFQCSCAVGYIDGGGGSVTGSLASTPYRHHYVRTNIGNPSTYTLHEDSRNLKCSHTTLTWNGPPPGHVQYNEMADSGLYYSFMGQDIGCSSVCSNGWSYAVLGPSGSTLGAASCDPPE